MSSHRIKEFDGLRGAAVLTVVLGHYCSGIIKGVSFFNYASMGVDVFFVLSGFLVGGIILDGVHEDGFLNRFFRRRAARILPLYFAVLAFALIIQKFCAEAAWDANSFPAWTYATFTMNIWSAIHAQESAPFLSPIWSLSVEEKFYLLAPFLLSVVPRKLLPTAICVLCLAAIAFRYAFRPNILAMELVLPARMDSLLIGVGVAFIQRSVALMRFKECWKPALFAIPLIYLPIAVYGKQFVLGHTFFALITAAYMLAVLSCSGTPSIFRGRLLAFFASISYCMYLIHEPVNVLLTGTLLGKTVYAPGYDRVFVTMLSFAVTVGLAILSKRYFENPILQWESNFTRSLASGTTTPVPEVCECPLISKRTQGLLISERLS